MDERIIRHRPDLDPAREHARVRLHSIKRRSDVCVIMPTCGTAEVTFETIAHLFALHSAHTFDLLLVDNASDDHRAIIPRLRGELGLEINHLVMFQNGGSAGGQNAGAKAALAAGYEFLVFSDNDARLQTREGITALIAHLDQCDVAFPANVERAGRRAPLPFGATLHYLAVRGSTLCRIGNIEPFFFLSVDDVEFVMRALSLGLRVEEVAAVEVRHPLRKIALLSNRTAYFIVRNYCFLLAHSPVSLRFRLRAGAFLTAYVAMKLAHAMQFRDASVIHVLLKAVRDFHRRRLDQRIPREKFSYELAPSPTPQARYFWPLLNRIFLAKSYRLIDGNGRTIDYTLAL